MNNILIRGETSAEAAIKAICAGYGAEHPPAICSCPDFTEAVRTEPRKLIYFNCWVNRRTESVGMWMHAASQVMLSVAIPSGSSVMSIVCMGP